MSGGAAGGLVALSGDDRCTAGGLVVRSGEDRCTAGGLVPLRGEDRCISGGLVALMARGRGGEGEEDLRGPGEESLAGLADLVNTEVVLESPVFITVEVEVLKLEL